MSDFDYLRIFMSKPLKTIEIHSTVFSKRLSFLIKELQVNQKDFAVYVGVSEPVISRAVKYGIIPSTKILIKIANALKIPLAYLLGLSDETDIYLSETPTTFHTRLDFLKCEKNVTYGQVAQKMTFSKNYFYEWQRLKTYPSIHFLQEIANYFSVSLDFLVGRTDDRQN